MNRSLFDTPSTSVFAASADWVMGTLMGSAAISLCVIAVAIVGMMMLTGRLAIRDGARVIIGCFVLLGAPILAAGFFNLAPERAAVAPPTGLVDDPPPARNLPPSEYDPYAGASLRDDR